MTLRQFIPRKTLEALLESLGLWDGILQWQVSPDAEFLGVITDTNSDGREILDNLEAEAA